MKSIIGKSAALGFLATLLVAAPGLAFGQTPTSVKGMIISHEGSTIVVRGAAGDTPINITDSTKIRGTSGTLGVRGDDHPQSALIRGLAVEVTTDGSSATEITFKNSSLKTAKQINAGLATTDDQVAKNAAGVAENAARIDNVGELVPAGRTKVFFATGSTTLSEKGKQDLQAIAAQANAIQGAYRLAVVGRADSTGDAAANERLSIRRAAAVKSYLIRSCGVSPANFLPSTALGSAPVAQDVDPPANNDEARRVTVTIAVSKSARPA
jgi:outer membrane protein OmpA-like peptidoglycan-associated protein